VTGREIERERKRLGERERERQVKGGEASALKVGSTKEGGKEGEREGGRERGRGIQWRMRHHCGSTSPFSSS
jgi:hypothetical protein